MTTRFWHRQPYRVQHLSQTNHSSLQAYREPGSAAALPFRAIRPATDYCSWDRFTARHLASHSLAHAATTGAVRLAETFSKAGLDHGCPHTYARIHRRGRSGRFFGCGADRTLQALLSNMCVNLKTKLGARLLNRTTRQFSLTRSRTHLLSPRCRDHPRDRRALQDTVSETSSDADASSFQRRVPLPMR